MSKIILRPIDFTLVATQSIATGSYALGFDLGGDLVKKDRDGGIYRIGTSSFGYTSSGIYQIDNTPILTYTYVNTIDLNNRIFYGSTGSTVASWSSNSNDGISYDSNYVTNFSTYSLVTKQYVDSAVISAGLTATNGLIEIATNVVALGGALTQHTTIAGNNNSLQITGLTASNLIDIDSDTGLSITKGNVYLNDKGDNGYISISGGTLGDALIAISSNGSLGAASIIIRANTDASLSLYESYKQVILYGQNKATVSGATVSITTGNTIIEVSELGQSVVNNGSINSIVIQDNLNLKGAVYATDYSANFTPESLVSKRYVDSAVISAGLTATNGLTEIATNVIALGGALTQHTTINAAGYDLIISDVDNLMFATSIFDVNAELIIIDAGTGSADIYADAGISLISIGGVNIVTNNNINMSATAGVITTTGLKGLVYATDYSTTFVTHSLVDKAYVDTAILVGSGTPVYSQMSLTPTGGFINLDGESTGLTITSTPNDSTRVQVFVNGSSQRVGDGASASVDCYFGNIAGTPLTISSIVATNILYWNAVTAGFTLSATDIISIAYNA